MQQLQAVNLVSPGIRGLNLQQEGSILDAGWVTEAQNCVLDANGRLASRKGYAVSTATPIGSSPAVLSLFEYLEKDGVTSVMVGWDGGIANDISNPAGNDISASVTDSSGEWWFQNFNDKVLGFIHGQKPIVRTSVSNFATVVESSGTAPTSFNGVALCAFGRVWALDSDGQTIKYSATLDETDWGGADAGSIDMSKIWTKGMDVVTAIASISSALVVFGQKHIVIWDDGEGSQLGVDPLNLIVVDVLEGTGTITQWSLQAVGEADLLYLSRSGVQSLGRAIQQKNNPLATVSKSVRDSLLLDLANQPVADIRSVYSPEEGFYLLSLPAVGRTWVFDERFQFQDERGDLLYPVTRWNIAPTAMLARRDGSLLLGAPGVVWSYEGSSDDGEAITIVMETPWLDLGEQLADRVKLLKRLGAILEAGANTTVVFSWATDFGTYEGTVSRTIEGDSAASEFSIAEFGLDEFGGSVSLTILKMPARARGQYYRLKIETSIAGEFALQQLELFAKIGRIA